MTFFTLLQNRTGAEPEPPPPSPGGLGGGGWGGVVYQQPKKKKLEKIECFIVPAIVVARGRRPAVEVGESVQISMTRSRIGGKPSEVAAELRFSEERAAEEEMSAEAILWIMRMRGRYR